ncbi:MAG: CHAT domain-containing protein [Novipirellula sp. JB048]
MSKPVLGLQTIYFDESDREDARRLGKDLYHHLTRPLEDPLAYGPGIPVAVAVAADAVDLQAADVVVLLPVLGAISFGLDCDGVLAEVRKWHEQLGPGHVLPVPISTNWRTVEDRLLGKQLLTELYGGEHARAKTVDEIVLAASRLLSAVDEDRRMPNGEPLVSPQLFVSHAKADLAYTDAAAKKIHDYVVTDGTGSAFFDSVDLHAGESLAEQLDDAVQTGVLIVVRSDSYSSRAWCQRELLRAKLHELPTLTVEVLHHGEHRSSPYGGNSPSIVWNGDPAAIASRAMVEWLRAAFFRLDAKRVAKVAELPADTCMLSRPPELLDLAQGPLQSSLAQLIMHPDPELPVIERQVLRAARPRLQVVTPTTAFRRLLGRDADSVSVSSPLEGMQIAMSLSASPDVDGPAGFTADHVIDATVYVARALISAGAAIAYGGDFRRSGFTQLLASLIQTYNQTASESAGSLHSYLAANLSLEELPDGLPLKINHLARTPAMANEAILPAPTAEAHPSALYFSDLRRVMAMHTDARVVLGGQGEPRIQEQGPGYGGRYPGIVEEAWRTMEADKPVYILGGFGGAAALVAGLMEGRPIPPQLDDATWRKFDRFAKNVDAIDADPYRSQLGLPKRMEDLAKSISELSQQLLANDHTAVSWNGLTLEENQTLFRSRDPVTLASLVLKGLLNVSRQQNAGKLVIELVRGSVTAGTKLGAVAIATFDNVPLGGAGAVLDEAIGGRATLERASGRSLFQLGATEVDADWMYLASLKRLDDIHDLEQRIEQAARDTAEQAGRHGFRRIGVVAFGGAVLPDVELVVQAMLRGFQTLPPGTTLVWFEIDERRYGQIRDQLSAAANIKLTTQETKIASVPMPVPPEAFMLQVTWQNDELAVTALPPAGSAVASSRPIPLTASQLAKLAEGRGGRKRATPRLNELPQRGEELAKMLFGDDAAMLLQRCRQSPMAVIHDVPSSKIPFELLAASNPAIRPAIDAGIYRRLAIANLPVDRLFARPPKQGKLNVLLIINPSGDLPGAMKEGEQVKQVLQQHSNRVNLVTLIEDEATVEVVQGELARADVLHYCGHAYFDGPGPQQSGLLLAGHKRFTAADLSRVASLPRVAFVNACEAGRVRGQVETNAAAFAELFLRSGVEAYIGTFWEVSDSAATSFAAGVYIRLASGERLDAAVQESRKELYEAHEADWANYILYGDGRFQLVMT